LAYQYQQPKIAANNSTRQCANLKEKKMHSVSSTKAFLRMQRRKNSGGWFFIIFDVRLLVLGKRGNMCRTDGRITKYIYYERSPAS